MKKFSQYICMFLIVVLIFPITALAVEPVDPRASSFFAADTYYLYKVSNDEFAVCFDVTGVKGMDVLGVRKIVVQRSTNGSSWESVDTFTKETNPEFIAYDTSFHGYCMPYSATKGYYYKASVVFYAKSGTGIGELTRETSSLKM